MKTFWLQELEFDIKKVERWQIDQEVWDFPWPITGYQSNLTSASHKIFTYVHHISEVPKSILWAAFSIDDHLQHHTS